MEPRRRGLVGLDIILPTPAGGGVVRFEQIEETDQLRIRRSGCRRVGLFVLACGSRSSRFVVAALVIADAAGAVVVIIRVAADLLLLLPAGGLHGIFVGRFWQRPPFAVSVEAAKHMRSKVRYTHKC